VRRKTTKKLTITAVVMTTLTLGTASPANAGSGGLLGGLLGTVTGVVGGTLGVVTTALDTTTGLLGGADWGYAPTVTPMTQVLKIDDNAVEYLQLGAGVAAGLAFGGAGMLLVSRRAHGREHGRAPGRIPTTA
jgi:hypothetical protein